MLRELWPYQSQNEGYHTAVKSVKWWLSQVRNDQTKKKTKAIISGQLYDDKRL